MNNLYLFAGNMHEDICTKAFTRSFFQIKLHAYFSKSKVKDESVPYERNPSRSNPISWHLHIKETMNSCRGRGEDESYTTTVENWKPNTRRSYVNIRYSRFTRIGGNQLHRSSNGKYRVPSVCPRRGRTRSFDYPFQRTTEFLARYRPIPPFLPFKREIFPSSKKEST